MNGVNGKVLAWARKRKDLSRADVAKKFKISEEIVENWESGNDAPKYQILEKLAYEIYQIPLAGFFVSKIPVDVDPEAKFRRLLSGASNQISIKRLIHKAARFQAYVEEISEGLSKWEKRPKVKIAQNTIRENLLEILQLDSSYASGIKLPEDHFDLLREKLYDVGIYVFKSAFKDDDISGFCLPSETYPVIMVNNSSTATRQIFTVIHEFCHILKDSFGLTKWNLSIGGDANLNERNEEHFCNSATADFLVPKSVLDGYLKIGNYNTEAFYEKIASELKISREIILRICLDRELINENTYSSFRAKWNSQIGKKGGSGGNYYYTQRTYLGKRYVNDVLSGYYQKKWDKFSASEYLDIKIDNFEKFEKWTRG